MGLILEPDGSYVVLSDILGSEDALGDMDFKVRRICSAGPAVAALHPCSTGERLWRLWRLQRSFDKADLLLLVVVFANQALGIDANVLLLLLLCSVQVAGGARGITAFQMDIKVEGITLDIMRQVTSQHCMCGTA